MSKHFVVFGFLFNACSCGGISVDEMPGEIAKTVCTKMYGCCTADEVKNNPTYGPDEATCETNVKKGLSSPQVLKTSEGKGHLAYHADQLATCLSQYKALTCDQLKSRATSTTAACDAFIEPKVAVGSACGYDVECISSSCEGETTSADGLCTAFLAENVGCNDGGTCGSGLYCDVGSHNCTRLKSDGASCYLNLECSTGGCNGKDPDAGTAGTCGLKGGAGTTCYATSGCSSAAGAASLCAVMALAVLWACPEPRRRALRRGPAAG